VDVHRAIGVNGELADRRDGRWNVPINGLVAKLSSFGTFPASYQLGGGYFVVHPDNGATWKIRAAITILLPRKK